MGKKGLILFIINMVCNSIFICALTGNKLIAQEIDTEKTTEIGGILELIENGYDENEIESSLEELINHYEQLAKRAVNINKASASQLRSLSLLTPFQIESIIHHRKTTGPILSIAELGLIHGFNSQIAHTLAPFFSFNLEDSYSSNSRQTRPNDLSSKFYTRWRISENGSVSTSHYTNLKYNLLYNNKIGLNLTLEKDFDEEPIGKNKIPFGDFTSGAIGFYNYKWGKVSIDCIILGDLKVNFGQGLTLCNTLTLGGAKPNVGYMIYGEPISQYRSNNEYKYLRGWGSTISIGHANFSFIASYRPIDATLNPNGSYKSLKSDGLHVGANSIKSQSSMNEVVLGLNGSLNYNKFKIGLSYCTYSYSRPYGGNILYYNNKRLYYGYHQNLAIDFYTLFKGHGVYGEIAASIPTNSKFNNSTTFALLLGSNIMLKNGSLSILGRYYADGYIATHGGAYSSLSYISNQLGLTFDLENRLFKKIRYSLRGQFSYYPGYRYNIKASSSKSKIELKIGWSDKEFFQTSKNEVNVTVGYKCTQKYYSNIDSQKMTYFKCSIKKTMYKSFTMKYLLELNSYGCWGNSLVFNFSLFKEHVKVNLGCLLYNVNNWEGRISLYEYDIPQTLSTTLLYRKGVKFYTNINCKISKNSKMALKIGQNRERRDLHLGIYLSF